MKIVGGASRMEVPNKNIHEEVMDFKKFAQSRKGLMYSEDKLVILGTFKCKGSEKVYSGDNFKANKVWKSGECANQDVIYKTYLEWFNYTLRQGEKERVFASAKFGRLEDLE